MNSLFSIQRQFIVLSLFLFCSCASHNTPKDLPQNKNTPLLETTAIDRSVADNEIRPGFLLSIRHSIDRKLSGNFKVNWDGSLNLPYGKTVQTEDKTLELLTEELKSVYSSLFKSNNYFQVSIAQKTYAIEVRGLVKKPGALSIKPTTTLEEILTKAETDKEQADFVRIELSGKSQWVDLKQYNSGQWPTEKMPKWAGGETLWFVRGDSNFTKGSADIRLMGEVNQPGTFSFQSGKNVLDYITLAGGLKTSANVEKVYIYRPVDNRQAVANFSILEPQDFQLAPGDTLLITSERTENIERKVQMGANIAAILSAIGIILIAL
jgi:protein involved in polysaccharide export with SLBB domain